MKNMLRSQRFICNAALNSFIHRDINLLHNKSKILGLFNHLHCKFYNGFHFNKDHYKNFVNNNSSCLSMNHVKNLKTDIFTEDNIVNSPYTDVIIPNCLLHECVWSGVEKWPDKIAIECGLIGRKYTFSQLRKFSKTFAASLLKSGLKPGDVVSVILPNVPEYPIALFGASEAGMIVSPVNPAYTADEICHQLSDSKSVCIITVGDKLVAVKDAIRKLEEKRKQPVSIKIISIQDYDGVQREYPTGVWSLKEMFESNVDTSIIDTVKRPTELALLPYSSGTTGMPKGVCLTHHNIVSNSYQIIEKESKMNKEPEGDIQDIAPAVLPFFHIYGLVIILIESLKHGGRLITLPKFDPDTYIKVLGSNKSTLLYTVPPLVLFLSSHPAIKKEFFQRVRFSLSAAAPIGLSDIERLVVNFPKDAVFKQCYGLTETSPVTMMSPNQSKAVISVGPPVSLTKVKVIDYNSGKSVGVEEKGEICINGPQVMMGYLNRPEATKEMIDEDGWLHTGDIGYYDRQGNFFIVDRIKELIKVKGFQVAPAELEEVLRCHPKVAEVAVIGIPDPKTGELPIAYVVPKPGERNIAKEELKHFVAEKVTKYKQLADIIFTDDIPKNPSGKILRRKIKEFHLSQ